MLPHCKQTNNALMCVLFLVAGQSCILCCREDAKIRLQLNLCSSGGVTLCVVQTGLLVYLPLISKFVISSKTCGAPAV